MADDKVQTAGRKRPKPEAVRVAKRVARFLAEVALDAAKLKGVQPLNAGFFVLEAMRHANVKARSKHKAKARGK